MKMDERVLLPLQHGLVGLVFLEPIQVFQEQKPMTSAWCNRPMYATYSCQYRATRPRQRGISETSPHGLTMSGKMKRFPDAREVIALGDAAGVALVNGGA